MLVALAGLLAAGCPPPPPEPPDPLLIADPPPTEDGRLPGAGVLDFDRGIAYVKSEEYAAAIPHFDRALAARPDDAQAEYYRALSYDMSGNSSMATQGYARAVELDAEFIEPRVNLAAIYLGAEPPDPTKALVVLEPAAKLDPKAADIRENLAFAYRLAKDYDKAAVQYGAALKLQPSGRLYFAYGDMLFEAGRLEDAADQLKKALTEYKDNQRYVVVIAHRFAKAKRYRDCVDTFTLAIGLNAKEPGFFIHRGLCKHSLHEEEGARADYRAAIELDGANQGAWYYLGRSWLAAKKRGEAASALDKAWTIDKSSRVGKKAKEQLDLMRSGRR